MWLFWLWGKFSTDVNGENLQCLSPSVLVGWGEQKVEKFCVHILFGFVFRSSLVFNVNSSYLPFVFALRVWLVSTCAPLGYFLVAWTSNGTWDKRILSQWLAALARYDGFNKAERKVNILCGRVILCITIAPRCPSYEAEPTRCFTNTGQKECIISMEDMKQQMDIDRQGAQGNNEKN